MTWPIWLKPTVWLVAVCHVCCWFLMGLRLMLVTLGLWLAEGLRERMVLEALVTGTPNLAAGIESACGPLLVSSLASCGTFSDYQPFPEGCVGTCLACQHLPGLRSAPALMLCLLGRL